MRSGSVINTEGSETTDTYNKEGNYGRGYDKVYEPQRRTKGGSRPIQYEYKVVRG